MKTLGTLTYVLIIVVLAVATVVERLYGTARAHELIYAAPWFYSLWAVLAIGGIFAIVHTRMWRRLPTFLLHVSFLVILLGALLTTLFSHEQVLHLREGETTKDELPFCITLQRFQLQTYPGTERPQDFISHITYVDGSERGRYAISMNHIFSRSGYRLYQTSYDDDLRGTFLTVKYDLWGVGVTYTGYALLFLSMLLVLFSRHSRFRQLLRQCMSERALTLLLIAFVAFGNSQPSFSNNNSQPSTSPYSGGPRGSSPSPRAITSEHADQFMRKQVVYNGRIVPLRTLALDFCLKVTGKRSFAGLSAQQLMLSLMIYPDDWKGVRIIKVEDASLRQYLGIEGKYAAMTDFFNADGSYRLTPLYQRHKSTDDAIEKSILKVDERCALIVMLLNGELITPVPHGVERPSEALVTAEIIYDAAPWSLILFIVAFILAIVSIVGVMVQKFKSSRVQKFKGSKSQSSIFNFQSSNVPVPVIVPVIILFLSLLSLYILRWVIQGHIPLSNGYETMLFIALISSFFAAFILTIVSIARANFLTLLASLCLLVTAFTLLVSHLSFMSPEMTPLMPVLQSPLLSIHVSVIMMSYALFAILTLLSLFALLLQGVQKLKSSKVQEFKSSMFQFPSPSSSSYAVNVSIIILYPAVFLLTAGIFIGAIWANISWGTYWSWDPKETWALITLMIYAVPLHPGIRAFRRPPFYHAYMVLAFLSVLITYFGVNYLLGGMHSYA